MITGEIICDKEFFAGRGVSDGGVFFLYKRRRQEIDLV